ncbi:hypothetical protein WG904_10825 [Pedobacter sp. Du54]|uniref:hypothetical protein n=1 Tax=Pedobacter anseongensis TaxID=3133439 RepID=UPI00309E3AB8
MKKLFIYVLLCCLSYGLKAQQKTTVSDKIEAYNSAFPKEKLYLSFDKPYYNTGDTLWFKSVLLESNHTINNRTDKIYVELFNDSSEVVDKRAISLNNGLGYGDFTLKKLTEGTYTIRAYSNWQQNFGNDYFFQKSIYIGNVGNHTLLVDSYQKLNTSTTKRTLDLKIRLTNIKNEAAGLRDVEVYLMKDKDRIMRADLQTSQAGLIETQIPLGDNKITGNYSFYIIDKKDRNRKAVVPILLQDIDEIDLQFMPEGGYMVNGIYGKVAFKALGADGLGKNVKFKIINTKNEVLTEAASLHRGMGSFYLLPQKGENYAAIFTLNGKEQKLMLPSAKDEGTTLKIDHLSKPDSLLIYIKASETKRIDQPYQLVAQAADENIMTIAINLKNGFSNLKLAKSNFPDGIIHFTLFSPEQLPLNERQAFINHKQKIKLTLQTAQHTFQPRDSISIEISASKEDGSPLSGTFALSVTDNTQVKQTENENNMASYFLLQSNLKGNIEEAYWYFTNEEPSTSAALDQLLLTQSWVGYQWKEILKPLETPKFKAEKGNLIEGKVTGLLNKPMPNIDLKLLSLGKSIFFADTLTNAEGKFTFKNIPFLDSAAYSIKIKNAKGKTAGGVISVDEFMPSKELVNAISIKPWYVNADSISLNYFKTVEKQKKPIDTAQLKLEGNKLKEVEIMGNIKEKNFIQKTAWDATLFKKITEEELKKKPRQTLFDLLYERIDGFTTGSFYADGCFGTEAWGLDEVTGKPFPPAGKPRNHRSPTYMIGQKPIAIVTIDKINTVIVEGREEAYQGSSAGNLTNMYNVSTSNALPDFMHPTNTYIFNALSAEDIKDITVYKGCNSFFLDITTRSGKGPWIAPTKGGYVYRPQPSYVPKEFYSPKYGVNKSLGLPDLRSTIFWDANVVTDENGKAKLSFYAADLPGSYTIKIEGTDLQGRFGYQKSTITIKNKTESK